VLSFVGLCFVVFGYVLLCWIFIFMKKIVDWKVPITTVSEYNLSEHWSKTHKRHKVQDEHIFVLFKNEKPNISLPCHIKLSRIAPRELDFDNLTGSLKAVRDSVASYIIPGLAPGRADGDKQITWEYNQEKGKVREYAVKIEIFHTL
jgi:hypothetical protein